MLTLSRRHLGGLALGSLAAAASSAQAADGLAIPAGKTILTITGAISRTNVGDAACFDRDMLEALPQETVETTTPWYNGPVKFEGVRMSRLMQTVGATGNTVTAVALNDYSTTLPMADFEKFGTLLAIKRDGAYMPVRDKGPLFIIYPFDSMAELKTQQYFSRAAWQLARLQIQ